MIQLSPSTRRRLRYGALCTAFLTGSLACARSLDSNSPSFWSISGKSQPAADATQLASTDSPWGLAPSAHPAR
jgi:hypothetical protein